jgi:hypothetical protein
MKCCAAVPAASGMQPPPVRILVRCPSRVRRRPAHPCRPPSRPYGPSPGGGLRPVAAASLLSREAVLRRRGKGLLHAAVRSRPAGGGSPASGARSPAYLHHRTSIWSPSQSHDPGRLPTTDWRYI